jgi:hypothetical protein
MLRNGELNTNRQDNFRHKSPKQRMAGLPLAQLARLVAGSSAQPVPAPGWLLLWLRTGRAL